MADKKAKSQNPSGPSQSTIKRLFAQSGNRCAFPKCPVDIIQGATVVGKICHIKAANPKGPRYDAQQTPEDRHGYDNLMLLCANHHTVIDDDEEAYTAERLIKMKRDHEQRTSPMKDNQVEEGAQLLIDQAVATINQSGGITAHTIRAHTIIVHSSDHFEASATATVSPPKLPAVDPKDGEARFRSPGEPLGVEWRDLPFAISTAKNIFLSTGSAMWLRLMSPIDPAKTWSLRELKECAIGGGTLNLAPFLAILFTSCVQRMVSAFISPLTIHLRQARSLLLSKLVKYGASTQTCSVSAETSYSTTSKGYTLSASATTGASFSVLV